MAEKKAAKKEEKEEADAADAPKPKSKKKLLLILIPVVLLLVGGGAAFFLMGGKPALKEGEEGTEEVVVETKAHNLSTLKLDPFIVNLSENISFLKVTMILEYDPAIFAKAEKLEKAPGETHGGGGSGGEKKEEGGGIPPRLNERQPMVRDAVIHILSSKKVAEVLTSDGKEKLKEELIEAINDAIGLPENPVINVYFLEFIIQ